jgi:uncharacterized protein (DUF2236 family)
MPVGFDGYFPPGSMLRRVQSERAVGLLFGQRALMLGAMMHPLAYYGTAAHTRAKTKPFQRLAHTATMFEAVFFGSREEANRALAFVHRLHERVSGNLPEDIGPWPAGTAYSALDPEEMLWGVVATTFDSAQAIYETLVGRLADDEREEMWQDYITFGELFGMARSAAPQTYLQFRAAWNERLHSDLVFLTEEARSAGYETGFGIPVPAVNRPGMWGLEFLLRGSLPGRARELYGLNWTRRDQAAFEALTFSIRRGLPLTPSPVRRGSCRFLFDMVASTERRWIRGGRAPALFEAGGSSGAMGVKG